MNCGNCRNAHPDGARFCGRCGAKLTDARQDQVGPVEESPSAVPGHGPPVPRHRRAMTAVAVVIVKLGALGLTGWREHWPPAVFGRAASSRSASGLPAAQTLTWSAAEAPLPADAVPSPSDGYAAILSGVTCPAEGTCVAAGWYINQGNYYDGLIETLSHGTWIPAPPGTPVPSGAAANPDPELNAVTCLAPGSCAAVGNYSGANYDQDYGLIEALSGGAWTPSSVAPPATAGNDQQVSLDGLACPTASSCVAVGSNFSNSSSGGIAESQALMAVPEDGAWAAAEVPLPTDAVVANHVALPDGVACPAPSSCIATGEYADANGNSQGLFETLADGTFTPATAPLPAGAAAVHQKASLGDVACRSSTSCVAAGGYTDANGDSQDLIETLVNGTWIPLKAPLPSGAAKTHQNAYLGAVACTAKGNCVAVGNYTDSNKDVEAVIEISRIAN